MRSSILVRTALGLANPFSRPEPCLGVISVPGQPWSTALWSWISSFLPHASPESGPSDFPPDSRFSGLGLCLPGPEPSWSQLKPQSETCGA